MTNKEKAVKLHKEGKSYNEIAKTLGISKSNISYYLSKKAREVKRKRETARKQEHKRLLVEYKGGKCSICGYDKYIGALDFHHVDPNKKDFSVSSWANSSLILLKAEADKCILVCSNCHRELHNK